jgi:hypothetical protein|tara:strand:+ start:14 stop:133 length:120 start_codon:yes stop_codon:yes gene_type:complete
MWQKELIFISINLEQLQAFNVLLPFEIMPQQIILVLKFY